MTREQRRAVIEDAAAAVFAEHGYAAARLEDIAAAAGITKQLLYRHFASKRELHLALLAKHRDGLVARIAPGPVRDVLDAWFAYVEEHPYAARLLFRDTTGEPEIAAFHLELQASARAANAAVLRARDLPEDLVEPTAELIRAGTVGLALWWSDHPDVPRATVVDAAARLFNEGVDADR